MIASQVVEPDQSRNSSFEQFEFPPVPDIILDLAIGARLETQANEPGEEETKDGVEVACEKSSSIEFEPEEM
jgi:hypothetical protein